MDFYWHYFLYKLRQESSWSKIYRPLLNEIRIVYTQEINKSHLILINIVANYVIRYIGPENLIFQDCFDVWNTKLSQMT